MCDLPKFFYGENLYNEWWMLHRFGQMPRKPKNIKTINLKDNLRGSYYNYFKNSFQEGN